MVSELDRFLFPSYVSSLRLSFVVFSWLFAACAHMCFVSAPMFLHSVFCPIIFFTNYSNFVSLIQLRTPRYAFDGNTLGKTGNWDPVFMQLSLTEQQKIWTGETCVFDFNSNKSDFNVCMKQKPAYNGLYRANMHKWKRRHPQE